MQRFKKADKRAKLPKWMGSYIKEENANLSTDLALVQSRKFLRDMAQPFEQSGKSLWGIEELQEKQRGADGRVPREDRGDDYEMDEGEEEQRADQPRDVKMEEVVEDEEYFGGDDMDEAGLEELQAAERAAMAAG